MKHLRFAGRFLIALRSVVGASGSARKAHEGQGMKRVRAALVAGGMALGVVAGMAPAPVSATLINVNLVYQGADVFGGGGKSNVTVTKAPPATGTMKVAAGGFRLRDTTGTIGDTLGNFVAWCLDLATTIKNPPGSYHINNTDPFTNRHEDDPTRMLSTAQRTSIRNLFDAVYGGVDLNNNTQSAAFQVALWELAYETGTPGDVTQGAGSFFTSLTNGSNALLSTANGYLALALAYDGPRVYDLTFLQSNGNPDSQNLVTASVIPLPAAGWLLLGGLGALLAARRRRGAPSPAAA
jgi:hypothetical protein